jgi:hypothetical protein
LDGQVGRAAAASDAAAAAVKQRDCHVVCLARGHDLLLRAIERPRGRKTSRLFRRVRVADHDFLPSVDAIAVPGNGQQAADRLSCTKQIAAGLEQWHHALALALPSHPLEQFDGEHVRRRARHRDHVGAQRFGMKLRRHLECFDDVAHLVGSGVQRKRTGGVLGLRELPDKQRLAIRFRRIGVRAPSARPRDPGDGIRVP